MRDYIIKLNTLKVEAENLKNQYRAKWQEGRKIVDKDAALKFAKIEYYLSECIKSLQELI